MDEQRKDEWLFNYDNDYFERQFLNPYRSTIKIAEWIEELGILNSMSEKQILDIASGKGANLAYFNSVFPKSSFLGLDINLDFVKFGNEYFNNKIIDNCKLAYGDLYNLDSSYCNKYDGITCLQTISWLPNYEEALLSFIKLNPDWILLSSLFYEGNVNCRIEIEQFIEIEDNLTRKTFYNVYSIPKVQKFCSDNGYNSIQFKPFEIDIDIPYDNNKFMGTYTEKLENGKRIQVSGPLLMNWYFILIKKN